MPTAVNLKTWSSRLLAFAGFCLAVSAFGVIVASIVFHAAGAGLVMALLFGAGAISTARAARKRAGDKAFHAFSALYYAALALIAYVAMIDPGAMARFLAHATGLSLCAVALAIAALLAGKRGWVGV